MDVNRHNGVYEVADERLGRLCRLAARRDCGRRRRAARVPPRRRLHHDLLGHGAVGRQAARLLLRHHRDEAARGASCEARSKRRGSREAVIDGVKDPIFVKDSDLRFVFVNEAFASLFGMKPSTDARQDRPATSSPPRRPRASRTANAACSRPASLTRSRRISTSPAIGQSRIVRKNRVAHGQRQRLRRRLPVRRHRAEAARDRGARRRASAWPTCWNRCRPASSSTTATTASCWPTGMLQESLPALEPAWSRARRLRDALELAHEAGYFRNSGDPELDALYDTDPHGLDRRLRRALPRAPFGQRAPESGRPLVPGLRHAHRRTAPSSACASTSPS